MSENNTIDRSFIRAKKLARAGVLGFLLSLAPHANAGGNESYVVENPLNQSEIDRNTIENFRFVTSAQVGVDCRAGGEQMIEALTEKIIRENISLREDHPFYNIVNSRRNNENIDRQAAQLAEALGLENPGSHFDSAWISAGEPETGGDYLGITRNHDIVLDRVTEGLRDYTLYNASRETVLPYDRQGGRMIHTEDCDGEHCPRGGRNDGDNDRSNNRNEASSNTQSVERRVVNLETCNFEGCRSGRARALFLTVPIAANATEEEIRERFVYEAQQVSLQGFDAALISGVDAEGNTVGVLRCYDRRRIYDFDTDNRTRGRQTVSGVDNMLYVSGAMNERFLRPGHEYVVANNDVWQPHRPFLLRESGRTDRQGRPILELDSSVSLRELSQENFTTIVQQFARYMNETEASAVENMIITSEMSRASEEALRNMLEAEINRHSAYELASWIVKLRDGTSDNYDHRLRGYSFDMRGHEGESLLDWIANANVHYIRTLRDLER